MNFGDNLRNLRKNKKMSQEVLAEKLGVSRQSVSKWEVGAAYPEMTNIMALCTIFHCNITDLINENIADTDSFDEETKKDIVKFKENQQRTMKGISKAIYIIAKICKVVVAIPTVALILATFVFPFLSSNLKIEKEKIKIFNQEILYSIDNNVLDIDGTKYYINTTSDVKEFINNHDNTFFIVSIEYILFCISVLSILSVLFLHYLYKLYKNVYEGDTPFSIENEKLIRRAVLFWIIQFALTKITALLYSAVARINLLIEFNIRDIIVFLIAVSLVYIFKYGRMIQADSKAKIYGKVENIDE